MLNLVRYVRTAMATHLPNVERLSLAGELVRSRKIRHVEFFRSSLSSNDGRIWHRSQGLIFRNCDVDFDTFKEVVVSCPEQGRNFSFQKTRIHFLMAVLKGVLQKSHVD